MQISAFIGYDSRFPLAYAVTVRSIINNIDPESSFCFPIMPILLPHLQAEGAYYRPMHSKNGQMFDEISEAPMATEFAISRFFIPWLANRKGWSLFCDSDFLFRCDVQELFEQIDPSKAVMCVKHNYEPPEGTKMDGQMQTLYRRKNWSSLMLINNEHTRNNILDTDYLNRVPGRDLHAFSWLHDSDIGELDPKWNWLEGHSDMGIDPKIIHYTRGTPDMKGYEKVPYAKEWWAVANQIEMCKKL